MEADPATRASVPKLMGIILALWGFFVGMGWIHVRLNRKTKTTIYDRGLLHGSLTNKRWIPWSDMEYFYTDENSLGDLTFRFLSWSQIGEEDEDFSVVPDNVDLDSVVRCFKDNQVEQAEDGDTSQRPC